MNPFDELIDAFLAHFWAMHPVNASFAGMVGFDHLLPPATRDIPAREFTELGALRDRLDTVAIPDTAAARIDAQLMRGYLTSTLAGPRSRFINPTWYTGEIAFGLISLLLPGPVERATSALAARITAIPDQLAAGRVHLDGVAVCADWVRRARLECAAVSRLLDVGLPLHPLASTISHSTIRAAIDALERFDHTLGAIPDADPAIGDAYLALLIRDVHGLDQTPAEIERVAATAFAEVEHELETAAERLAPGVSWRACVDALMQPDLTDEASVLAALREWHTRAMRDAADLVTPADDYALTFAPLPAWALAVYADLYFLFYRSPAAYAPGTGSTYWATAPQSTATVKVVHAVHHGSIGHHTQNARARSARSRLARLAGSDAASGVTFLGAISLAEGWACYVEDVLAEVPDFYTPQELLLLTAFELRNIATCLGDIRLHRGVWSIEEMRRFYRDDAAFAQARIWSETTRNSIFPSSRLTYWMGTRQIRALRAQSTLGTKAFHDRLLSFGAAPVATIGRELASDAVPR